MHRLASLTIALTLAACGGGGDDGDGVLVLQDEASDEALVALLDAESRGEITMNDALAAHVTNPADGATLSTGAVETFRWNVPSTRPGPVPRHGIDTGQFVWLRIGGAVDPPIDVLSLSSTSWTPDSAAWSRITNASGTITCTITTAFLEAGVVTEGPYRPTERVAFTTEAW